MSAFEFFARFFSEAAAVLFFEEVRWGEAGVSCPRCKQQDVYRVPNGKPMSHRCRKCKRYFNVRIGTMLGDSRLPLLKWLYAIYLILTSRKGVSSSQMAREIGCTQRTAWFLTHRIREAIAQSHERIVETGDKRGFMVGVVEADETYVGGKLRPMHARRREQISHSHENKLIVLGFKERLTGRIWVKVINGTDQATLHREIRRVVRPGSLIYTDGHTGYLGLEGEYYHEAVDHKAGEYVRGDVTTNAIESFWGEFKRGYVGVYHYMSESHLRRYLWEFAHRRYLGVSNGLDAIANVARCLVTASKTSYKDITGKNKRREDEHG